MAAIQECYVNDEPKWLSRPDDSMICVMSHEEMASKNTGEVHDILKHCHICVIDHEPSTMEFDESGLSTLVELDKPITMHGKPFNKSSNWTNDHPLDFSKENKHDASSRHARGTLRDFLINHQKGNAGRSLNGLDFPMPWLDALPSSFATDVLAFNTTLNMQMCNKKTQFPASSMRWGLAATSNAYHLWHIDCDGLGTVVNLKTGYKLWILGGPKNNLRGSFSSIADFLENYKINDVNNKKMEIEAILLIPGSRL